MSNFTIPTKVVTGVNTRWSYANVWDPKSINGGKPKYKGIACGLNNLQKICDGEPLGSRSRAEDDFAGFDDDDNDDFLD